MSNPVKVAVFPVAGMGTRFLPITKAGPKEMLPIVDRPIIHYVVKEAVDAGIQHLVFVTSSSKRAIEDYFDSNHELEIHLERQGKKQALKVVRELLPANVTFSYVRQNNPAGLGDAVLCARDVVGDRPFAVLLADDVINPEKGNTLRAMIDIHQTTHSSVLAVEEVPHEETNKYGIVSLTEDIIGNNLRITNIIEKPKPEEAPSNSAVIGRYVFNPRIFQHLEHLEKGFGGEIQLTDAIAKLLHEENVTAYPLQEQRYDCGSKIGFLKATITFALHRQDISKEFREWLKSMDDLT